MPIRCCIYVSLLAITCGLPSTHPADLVYTRATLIQHESARIEVRRAYERRLELPQIGCADGKFSCDAIENYAQVYAVDAVRVPNGGRVIDNGRVTVALELDDARESELEEEIFRYLESDLTRALAPYAAFDDGDGPIDQPLMEESARPFWMCRQIENSNHATYAVKREVDGVVGSFETGDKAGDVADRVCRALRAAVIDVDPVVIESPPRVDEQRVTSVIVQRADTIEARTWADELAELPDSVTREKRPLEPGQRTGMRLDKRGEFWRGKEGRYGDVERSAEWAPAKLSLAGVPMWVWHWRFESERVGFGRSPRRDALQERSITVAFVPIEDPTLDPTDAARRPLEFPWGLLLKLALDRLDAASDLEPSQIEWAIANSYAWPTIGEWMLVVCRDDGTALYGFAPFGAHADVLNAEDSCAAISREL